MVEKIKYFKDKPVIADIIDLVVLCIITVIVGKLLTSFIILTGYVPSGSMETMIMTDDRILANRMAYWSSTPERGDIVVFYSPDDKYTCSTCGHVNLEGSEICSECNNEINGEITYFVKRTIGLPGETVTIKDNSVFINDIKIEEPYLNSWITTSGDEEFVVPEGHYFMLGDNRNDSRDSREWVNTFVPIEDIKGEVFLKYSLNLKNLHAKTIHSYNDYEV